MHLQKMLDRKRDEVITLVILLIQIEAAGFSYKASDIFASVS